MQGKRAHSSYLHVSSTSHTGAHGTRTIGSLLLGALLGLLLPSVATATPPAPKTPVARTGVYAETSTSSATLSGGVNPNGSETSYYFQYGPTTAYGAQTSAVSVGAGTTEVKVSQAIASLTPDSIYHYRLVASSAAGLSGGEDRTLTTKKVPLSFALLSQPGLLMSGSSLTISGTLSGSESAGRPVVLQSNPFPFLRGFKDVSAPELTDAAGGFSFFYPGLSENTQFRVATSTPPVVTSHTLIELVAVKVSLHSRRTRRHGLFKLYGEVSPAVPGALVMFQRMSHGRPHTVLSTSVKPGRGSAVSSFAHLLRVVRPGSFRAFVTVPSGKQISHYSRTLHLR